MNLTHGANLVSLDRTHAAERRLTTESDYPGTLAAYKGTRTLCGRQARFSYSLTTRRVGCANCRRIIARAEAEAYAEAAERDAAPAAEAETEAETEAARLADWEAELLTPVTDSARNPHWACGTLNSPQCPDGTHPRPVPCGNCGQARVDRRGVPLVDGAACRACGVKAPASEAGPRLPGWPPSMCPHLNRTARGVCTTCGHGPAAVVPVIPFTPAPAPAPYMVPARLDAAAVRAAGEAARQNREAFDRHRYHSHDRYGRAVIECDEAEAYAEAADRAEGAGGWVVVEPGGSVRVEPAPSRGETLPGLQRLVGGHIEALYLRDETVTAWANEEGALNGLDQNPVGHWLARRLGWQGMSAGPFVQGPIVLTGTNAEGDAIPLPAAAVGQLVAIVREATRD